MFPLYFGTRNNYTNNNAFLILTQAKYKELNYKELFLITKFIDLEKNLYTINHDILIHKVEHHELHNFSFRFLKSYLSSKSRYIKINNIGCGNSETLARRQTPAGSRPG